MLHFFNVNDKNIPILFQVLSLSPYALPPAVFPLFKMFFLEIACSYLIVFSLISSMVWNLLPFSTNVSFGKKIKRLKQWYLDCKESDMWCLTPPPQSLNQKWKMFSQDIQKGWLFRHAMKCPDHYLILALSISNFLWYSRYAFHHFRTVAQSHSMMSHWKMSNPARECLFVYVK